MLGWWFIVRIHSNQERSASSSNHDQHLLASWETGVSGLRWIEELVTQGVARKLCEGGYPSRYLVPCGPVLQLLLVKMLAPPSPPKTSSDWRDGRFVPAAIKACPADALLEVEAWDQS